MSRVTVCCVVCIAIVFKYLLIDEWLWSKNIQSRNHYVAAVVEYEPEGNSWELTPEEIIVKNAANYGSLIHEASLQNVDIIVFPEYGLTTLGIPRNRDDAKPFLLFVPDEGVNPCITKTGSTTIQEFSCRAKIDNIYVVINLGEIRPCNSADSCPDDNVFQFNTNVVFDRKGTIIAKYEKANLYFEDQFNKPNPVKLSTFKTDFGVEFGLFTCFDIIFYDPAVKLVETGVRNFIFPTAWVDELPFLTSIQAQATWAHSSDSNLLSSGYHQPIGGQLGSGIYAGRSGSFNYTFDPDSGTKVIIAEVPITVLDPNISHINRNNSGFIDKGVSENYYSFLREDLQNYTSQIVEFKNSRETITICTENEFCCELEYHFVESADFSPNSTENYRLLAFNGTRTVAAKTADYKWQICGIVRCLNGTLDSCSEIVQASSNSLPNFSVLRLRSTFDLHKEKSFLPGYNSLDIKMNLIPHQYFLTEFNDSSMQISSTNLTFIDVKTVALINKIFQCDSEESSFCL